MPLIVENLTKTYPNGVRALNGISLTIPNGLFGLLGPNGAGKSSLMRTIATLQEPDSGRITFDGIDALTQKDEMRRRLGYLPQEFGFYPSLSAEATLDHFALLKGLTNARERKAAVDALLAQTNLYEHRRKGVGGFSGGMRQRLGIAVALIGQPRLIIVDEPTAGLDPTERNRFLNLLAEVGENVVVILLTHIVEDVRELCSQMAIVAQGRVVAEGSPETVIAAIEGHLRRRTLSSKAELADVMARHRVVSTRLVAGRPVVVAYDDGSLAPDWTPVAPDLGDAYFFHTAVGTAVVAAVPKPPSPPNLAFDLSEAVPLPTPSAPVPVPPTEDQADR